MTQADIQTIRLSNGKTAKGKYDTLWYVHKVLNLISSPHPTFHQQRIRSR